VDAPAIGLDASDRPRLPQLCLRHTGADVVRRIQDRDVASDDRLAAVAEDPRRALAPFGDVPGLVEQEDGVVADVLQQRAEALLARASAASERTRAVVSSSVTSTPATPPVSSRSGL
jgi:hypothetical protein